MLIIPGALLPKEHVPNSLLLLTSILTIVQVCYVRADYEHDQRVRSLVCQCEHLIYKRPTPFLFSVGNRPTKSSSDYKISSVTFCAVEDFSTPMLVYI